MKKKSGQLLAGAIGALFALLSSNIADNQDEVENLKGVDPLPSALPPKKIPIRTLSEVRSELDASNLFSPVNNTALDLSIGKGKPSTALNLSLPDGGESQPCTVLSSFPCTQGVVEASQSLNVVDVNKEDVGRIIYNKNCDIISEKSVDILQPSNSSTVSECLGGLDIKGGGKGNITYKFRGTMNRDPEAKGLDFGLCPEGSISDCVNIEVGIEIKLGD